MYQAIVKNSPVSSAYWHCSDIMDICILLWTGFTGRNCQSRIRPCDSDPCFNGAFCVNKDTDYECVCTKRELIFSVFCSLFSGFFVCLMCGESVWTKEQFPYFLKKFFFSSFTLSLSVSVYLSLCHSLFLCLFHISLTDMHDTDICEESCFFICLSFTHSLKLR